MGLRRCALERSNPTLGSPWNAHRSVLIAKQDPRRGFGDTIGRTHPLDDGDEVATRREMLR